MTRYTCNTYILSSCVLNWLYLDTLGDIHSAESLLKDSLLEIVPELRLLSPKRVSAGVRVSTLDPKANGVPRLPLILQHPKHRHIWAITGFGSKGLIYHSMVSKYIVSGALIGDINLVPPEFRLIPPKE